MHTLDNADIINALKTRALTPAAWELVRNNFERSGGGSAGRTSVTESVYELSELGELGLEEYSVGGEPKVATTAMGRIVGMVGKSDRNFIVANADGNEASGIANINQALKIVHPTTDDLYYQNPTGQVYEPLSEDACAGLAVGLCLMGSRTLWCSYESFAINGLPIMQTVTQAMAELRRPTPSVVTLFTAGGKYRKNITISHHSGKISLNFWALVRPTITPLL